MVKQIVLTAVFTLLATSFVSAIEVGDVEVKETYTLNSTPLVLNGAGIREFLFLDFYVGALYLKQKETDSKKILAADEPMAIYIHWVASTDLKRGQKALRDGFTNAKTLYDYPKAAEETEKFINMVHQVKEGTIWQLEYTPEKGTVFKEDGKITGSIMGLDFKKNLFSIWLLENDGFKGDKSLRDAMLGKE